ncbi:catenin alpha-3-like isoform X1 [Leucoraja erinacea]|uniref:catenin alpha-3-like isoform X1 n=2 Tax=Leucoraja erinaceus TaxID=7782 RepID=UPI002458AED7|nr:catenin alpha-3-like isoform X1 [Leucoraja erinacea]
MTSVALNVPLKMDTKDLQIKTLTVERLIQPLILQVTTLVNCVRDPSKKKKGRSKRASVLLASVEEATNNLIEKGDQIAKDTTYLKMELTEAVQDVRREGETMRVTSKEFTDNPCALAKREGMVDAARGLLAAVTRLLILADILDVVHLLQHLTAVQNSFALLTKVSNEDDLNNAYRTFAQDLTKLDFLTQKRQQDLKSPSEREGLAAARACLKQTSPLLYSSFMAYLQHPNITALQAGRESVHGEIQEAFAVISDAVQGIGCPMSKSITAVPSLAGAIDEFENAIVIDPLAVHEDKLRPLLEKRLEGIVSEAAWMADSSCTRDHHREHIITECNAVRQALQSLLLEYMSNAGYKERSDAVNSAIENMCEKTRQLRRQLHKAIIDHVSDSFLDTTVPLLVLIEAAKSGNEKDINEYVAIFREHASKLVEVANLACSMSTNKEGINIIQLAGHHIEAMCPQVINAALALASSPKSQSIASNMEMYKKAWENHIRLLTEAVDDITSIDEFLTISESHILEDVNNCIISLRGSNAETLDRVAGAIQGRAARVAHVVSCEMENYESGIYTEKVMKLVQDLEGFAVAEFVTQVNAALERISIGSATQFDDSDFVEASRKVYDAVHDIRCAVLMIRTPEELEDMSDLEDGHDALSHTSVQTEGKSDRAKMTELPEEEKAKIAEQVADFKKVKGRLDAEIEIWDETSNDIIVLAKKMCMIMMEMTDFTRGRGPLKNTSDVINAAKTISDSGNRMDALVRQIANQCQDPSCKQDLLAYLEQIKLYSHQLKICSKVKAEIQNLSEELIVSALDSITSLILSAKNLMNTVVDTVKMSYIASIKIVRLQSPSAALHSVVMWRMKVPEKKPLIKRENPKDLSAVVRRGSTKKKVHPVKVMSEFRGRNAP